MHCLDSMVGIRNRKIPRTYTGFPWKYAVSFHLQVFGDASQKKLSACPEDGSCTSSLVMAQTRVAPLQKVGFP